MDLQEALEKGVSLNCTDIHFSVGLPIRARVLGELEDIDTTERVDDHWIELNILRIMDAYALKVLDSEGQFDMPYTIQSKRTGARVRFRVNVFKQKGSKSAVFRVLSNDIKGIDSLGLPDSFKSLTKERRGLILVTGVTGSGKSTTLASFVDSINRTEKKHIITLEEPIEYVHWGKKCIVNQRGVGVDVPTFDVGLRSALREDPDIILVGEMRDVETARIALQAAETGHLVLSTLHTMSAVDTIDRVVNLFPVEEQPQVRLQLSVTLVGILSQQLLPATEKKGYVLAYEFLRLDKEIGELILQGDRKGLQALFRGVANDTISSMDDCICELVSRGTITNETAISYAFSRKNMTEYINNLQ